MTLILTVLISWLVPVSPVPMWELQAQQTTWGRVAYIYAHDPHLVQRAGRYEIDIDYPLPQRVRLRAIDGESKSGWSYPAIMVPVYDLLGEEE